MAKQIALTLAKVKGSSNSADIIDQVSINTGNGSPVHVRAVDNVYYQLTDLETQYGPENIMTERVGNDLYVAFEGESIESPSLIIDDYYSLNPNGSKNLLVGQHENGSFYPYIPESAQQTDAVHMLADHVAAGQALGGDSSFAGVIPVEAGGAGWSPWAILGGIVALGGLSALAIAARNHDRHHHKHHDDQPQPQPNPNPQPNPQTIAPPTVAKDPTHKGGVTITPDNKATTLEIKYTDEAGQPHTIHVNKGTNGKWQADGSLPPGVVVDPNTGKVTLAPDSVKDGSSVTAKNSDGSHSSMESTVIADNDDATPQPNPNPNPNPNPGPGPGPNPNPGPNPPPANVDPTANADSAKGTKGQPVEIDVLANDSDPQGNNTLDPKSVKLIDPATNQPVTTLKVAGEGEWKVDPTTGKVTFTPEPTFSGNPKPVQYTVADSDGHTSKPATITVNYDGSTPPPANVDPTANADTAKGTKGQPVEIDVLANDSDPQGNNTLDPKSVKLIDPATNQPVTTLKVAGEGEWKVDPTTGKVTFTPEPTFSGNPKPVQYTVADSDGHTSKPATITVNYDGTTPPPANVDPTANADSAKGTKGQPVEIDVLANDSDPQGNNTLDPKSVKLIDPATNQPVTTLKVAGEGEWKVDPTTGKVTFTPEPTFSGNPKPVQYTVADSDGHTSKPATITVNYDGTTPPPANVDPTANADTAKGTKGQPVEIDVLANDSDPQGNNTLDPKSVKLIDPATNQPVSELKVAGEGEWKVDPTTGKVTFTPEPTFSGNPKPVQYTVADSDGHTSKPATITVNYDGTTPPPANVDPTANADTAKGTKGQPVEIDVLANDSDPQGNNTLDPKSVKLIDPATNQPVSELKVAGEGEWKVDPTTGKVTFTPEPTFSGNPKPVQYTVADSDGHTSKPATITVNYDGTTPPPANVDPTANADTAKGTKGQPVEIDVLANDSDPQGNNTLDPKSVKLIDPATNQPVSELKVAGEGEWKVDPTTGKVTFTPEPTFSGNPKPVQYTVADSDGHTSKPATITVNYDGTTPPPANVDPTANADTAKGTKGQPVEIDVLANDSDPQGNNTLDPKSVKLIDPATNQPVSELKVAGEGEWKVDPTTGKVTFTPEPTFSGNPKPVQYVVSDIDKHESQPGTITVTYDNVTPPQPQKIDPPTVAADPDHQGGMTVTPVDKATTLTVNYTDEKEQPQKITVVKDPQTGEWKPEGKLPSDDIKVDPATGKVTLPPDEVKDGSTVVAKNGDGTLTSDEKSGIAPNDDGSTPVLPAPTVAADPANQGGVVITPNDKATTLTVDYTDETGKPQHIQITKDPADNQWKPQGQLPSDGIKVDPATGKVTLPPGDVKDGSTVKAKNGDGTNESPEASVTAPQDANDAPVANADNMKGEPGKAVEIDVLKNDTDPQGESTIDKTSVKLLDPTTGAKVTELKVAGEGEWKVDPTTGKVTFTPDPAFKGNPKPVQYVVSDIDKHESQPGTITVTYDNVTPPQPQKIDPPTVAADPDHQGGMTVTPVDKATTLTVNYTDEKEQPQKITVVKDPQTGEWKPEGKLPSDDIKVDPATGKVTLPPDEVKDGSTVVAKNGDGTLTSDEKSGIAPNDDGSTPVLPAPTVAADPANQGGVVITPNDKATTLTVDYTDETGKPQHIQITKDPADNQWKPQGQLPSDGIKVDPATGKVTLPPGDVKDGSTVKAKNGDGTNESPEASVTAPQDANDAPVANADNMKGEPGKAVEIDVLKNDTDPQGESTIDKTSVKLLDPTTGAKVTELKVVGEGEWKVDPTSGKVTFTPEPTFTGNPKPVQYVVSDIDKHESQPGTLTVTYDNVTPPQPQKIDPPTVAADPDHQGGMTVTPVDKATTLTVNYTDEKEQPQKITVVKDPQTGEWKPEGKLPSDDIKVDPATGKVTLPPDEVKDGSTVVAKNGDGTLTSDEKSGIAPNDDGSTPVLPAPTVAADPANQGGVVITPNDKATTLTVDYTDETGKPQHIQITKDPADNQWKPQGQLPSDGIKVDPATGKVTLPPGDVKDGSTVKAKNGDGTNESPEASVTAPQDANDAPVANADNMKGEPGKAVEIDVLKNDTDPQGESTIDKTSVKLLDPTTGAKVTELKVAGEGEWKVDPTTGKVTFTPDPAFKGNPKPVQYVVSDIDKHESQPGTITVTYDNVTPPQPQKIDPPTVAADPDHQGGMTVTPVDKATTLTVNYTDEKEQPQKITVVKDPQTGEWKPEGKLPSDDIKVDPATGKVTLPPDEVKDGSTVVAKNGDGTLTSDEKSGIAPNDDGSTPVLPAPTVAADPANQGGVVITPNDKATTLTVDYTDETGKPQHIQITKDPADNQWKPQGQLPSDGIKVDPATGKVTLPPGDVKDGSTVKAKNGDGTNESPEASVTAPQDANDAPVANADNMKGEPGKAVEIDVLKNDTDPQGESTIDKTSVKLLDPTTGAKVTELKVAGEGEWKVDPTTGKVTFTPDPAFKGNPKPVQYVVSDIDKHESQPGTITVTYDNVTPPQPQKIDPPTVAADPDHQGGMTVTPVDKATTLTVNYTDEKEQPQKITVVKDPQTGEWKPEGKLPSDDIKVDPATGKVTLPPDEVKDGSTVVAKNGDGTLTSDEKSGIAPNDDGSTPVLPAPTVAADPANQGGVVITPNDKATTLTVDYTDETGKPQHIQITKDPADNQWKPQGQLPSDGIKVDPATGKVTLPPGDVKDGSTVKAKNGDGTNESPEASVTAPQDANDAPVANADNMKGEPGKAVEIDVLKNDTDPQGESTIDKTSVKLLDPTTGAKVTELKVAGEGEWKVDPTTGKVTFTPDPAFKGNPKPVQYVVSDIDKHESQPGTITVTYDNVTPPQPQKIDPPTVAADPDHQGGMTVTPVDKATTLTVNYTDEKEQPQKITVVKDPQTGEWKPEGKLPSDDIKVDPATGKVTLPPDEVKDGSTVVAKNGDGTLTSDEKSGIAPNDDGSTPVLPAPTVAADPANQGGVVITPNDKATTLTVDYTDETGKPQHIQITKDPADNQWKPQGQLPSDGIKVDPATGKVTLPPGDVKDGSTVKAKNGDGTNESPEASVTAPQDANDAPVANADNMKGEPGKAVEIDVLKNDTDPQGESTIDKTSVKLLDPTTGAKVTELKVAGEGEWKVDPTTGKVTFTPDPAFKGNPKPVQYVVSDIDKHESQPGTITVTYDNVTPPQPQKIDPPTVAADPDHQGGMTVTPVDKATTLTVNYTDEKEQPQKITVVKDPQTGEWKPEGKLPSDDIKVDPATGKVTLPPDEVKDGSTVVAKNGDGTLTSDEKSGIAPNDDGNTPSEVEVASITGDKAVEGTALTYDVTLNKVPTADTEVTLKLANGSGDVATDLGKEIEVSTDGGNTWTKVTPDADGNFKVTVPAGSTNGIKIQVPTVDDTAVEGDETIRLEGKAAKQADTVVGEGTIVDNDVTGREPPAPTVAQDPDHKGGMVITPADKADKLEVKYTDESDQPQTITVVKDPATGEWKPEGQLPSKDITVDPATGKVTLPPKDVKDGSDVTATNNVGPDSSVPAHGKADSNDVNPNPPQPNEPVVTISGSDKVNEGETATYTVKLDKPADKDVTVTVTLTHKGTEDADFTTAPDATKTLTIKAGETEAKITLEAAKDGKFEGAEHYNLSISNPQGAQLGTETSVDTQIVDGDTPPPPAVAQDPDHKGGMVITPTDGADKLEVKYTDESDQPQTITVVKDPTTGEWKPEGTLPHKDITVDPKTGKVTLPPDAVKDQSDVIAENSGGGKTSEGKGTAGEDDPNAQPVEPKVSISGDENVTEGESATYKVTLDKPADKDVTVTVTLKHGETSDADFSPAPEINKTLTIPAGKTEVEFKLNTVDDKQAEGKETYSLTLSEPKGAQLGDHTSVTTAINDATTPPPAIPQVKSVSSPQAEEGKALVYEVALDAPQADTPVELTLKNGTATLGTDTGSPIEVSTDGGTTWTPVTPGSDGKFTATVPAGSENGVKVRVPTVTDTVTEQDETLTLDAATKDQTTPATGTGTITDVPPPSAEVKSVSSPKVAEGEALVFDVAMDKPATDTEVSLTLKGDTATLGTDTGAPIEVSTDGGTTWTPVTPGSDGKFTATVPAGSENGVKVRVPTVTDKVTEQDETLTLDAATADQTTPATGTGTITDVPPVAPQAPSVAAGTEQGSVTVTPPAGADKLTVTYKDEEKADHEVVVNKDPASGEWKGTDLPEGVTVDAKTGVVTIAAKAVLDNSEVKAVAATGTLSSDEGSGTAGEDAVNNMTGEASSEAIAHDQIGLSGEYYGYNDDSIDRLVQNNPKVAANVRWHADDKTSPSNLNNGHNLYDLNFTEKMINGRNGGKVTGEIKSAAEGTPDARFTVTDINYGGKAAVSSGLANNEKTAVGQGLSQNSALRNFLDVNGAEDADSARVEAGAPYKGTSGLGYTTDAAVRIVGHVYFGEGTYDFKFALDNGATVRIDGKDIYKDFSISEADTLGKHPNGIHLTEGVHSVEIIYLEEGSVSTLHMQYKAHGAADSTYQTLGLDNNLMLKPEASLDLNQLQDVHNTGTANNPAWHIRTGATLDGGEGKDDITGSEGRDFIYGHDGNDSLTGGKGGDTFIYNTKAANGHDVIKDFKIGEDKISLTDLLDTKNIDAKAPGWKGLSEIQNAQWDDSAHKLSFDTTDGAKTYHNSITFEGMTQSYNSVDDFLRENGNGII